MLKPYDTPFLLAAFLSFVVSVALWFLVNPTYGQYVGLWVPSILALWAGLRVGLSDRHTEERGSR